MVRKKHAAKPANHERWLLTYADMITLLMIFFIVLWSMSNADAEKFEKISASLQRAFAVDVYRSMNERSRPSDADFDPRIAAYMAVKGQVQAVAAAQGLTQDTEVTITNEGILITLTGNFLFETGRADLRPEAAALLDTIVASVHDLPNELRVSGHTDSIPIDTPLFTSNWDLSAARAVSVVRYLAAAGIGAERLSAAGYGEFRPLVPNDTRANRARNRRAEILVVFPASPGARTGLPIDQPAAPRLTPIPASPTPAAQESH